MSMRPVYVWELSGNLIRNTEGAQDNFFRIMQAGGFDIAYVQFYESHIAFEAAAVEAFVARANAAGIQIHGILGAQISGGFPTLDSLAYEGGGIVSTHRTYYQAFLRYNIEHPTAQITGMNWDFESIMGRSTEMRDYMRAAKLVDYNGETMVSQGWQLSIYCDAPYWQAGQPYGNAAGVAAATDTYREFDIICINSYRDTVADIVQKAQDGPAVCESIGVGFLIGMESTELAGDRDIYSLWQEGKEYYENVLLPSLDAYYAGWSQYQGTYLHHLGGGVNRWWMIESVSFPGSVSYDPAALPVTLAVPVSVKLSTYYSTNVYGIKVSLVGPTTYEGSKIVVLDVLEGASVVVLVTIPVGAPPGNYSIVVDTWQLDKWSFTAGLPSLMLPNITQAELEALSMPQLDALNLVGERSPFIRLDYSVSPNVITVEEEVTPPEKHTLYISAVGNGTTSPVPDSYEVDDGQVVNLTAIPDTGYQFVGWSGSIVASSLAISVTVHGDVNAVATFEKIPVEEPTTSVISLAATIGILTVVIAEMAEIMEIGGME